MKKLTLMTMVMTFALSFAADAKAQIFNINLSSGGLSPLTAVGTITASVSDGGGIYTATAGTLTIDGLTLTLVPVPAGHSEVVVQNPLNSGGLNLSGDDMIGAGFIDSDGLVFTAPPTPGSTDLFSGDVVNLWGNGGTSYTAAAYGPDLPAGDPYLINLTGTVVAAPEPSSWAFGLMTIGMYIYLRSRSLRA